MPAAHTVCLLDDEPSVVKALGRLLASEGLTTEQFTESERFLAYARTHPVELAVLDVRMPGMSGLTVQSALRVMHPRVSVIVITAEDDLAHRVAAVSGGAIGFFLKPLNEEAFLGAVRTALHEAGPAAPST